MSGILDHSEGPVTQSMKTEFKQIVADSKAADAEYNNSINGRARQSLMKY